MHHVIKTYGEKEIYLHAFLISVLDEGGWSPLSHGCFTPGKITSPTYSTSDLLGLRTGLDTLTRENSLASAGKKAPIPRSSSPWPSRYINIANIVISIIDIVHIQ
jgi:hypothetical protein